MNILSLAIMTFFIAVGMVFYIQGQTAVQKTQAVIQCERDEGDKQSVAYKKCIEDQEKLSPLQRGQVLKKQAKEIKNLIDTLHKELAPLK